MHIIIEMCMNLHHHPVEIYIYNENEKKYKLLDKISSFGKSEKLDKNSKDLFGIYCQSCDKLQNDYEIHDNLHFENYSIVVCLFQTENGAWTTNKVHTPNFFVSNDILLVGDKEIISFIKSNETKLSEKMEKQNNELSKEYKKMKIKADGL